MKRKPLPELDHLAMMSNPMRWPHLVLPIKRYRNSQLEVACLIPAADGTFKVAYDTNIFMLHRLENVTWAPVLPKDLVAAGWEVD